MSSQVSTCYEIKFSGRYRGLACVHLNVTGHHTRIGSIWVWWEPPVWITDGRGQQCYRKAALWHLARETRRLSWALKIYSTSPSIRGEKHTGPGLGLSAGSGWGMYLFLLFSLQVVLSYHWWPLYVTWWLSVQGCAFWSRSNAAPHLEAQIHQTPILIAWTRILKHK